MKRKYIFTIIIALLIISISCTEDYLETRPLSFYAPENVYVDYDGFYSLVITMKKEFAKEHYGQFSLMVNEHACSDLFMPASKSNGAVKDFENYLTPAGDGNRHNFHSRLFDYVYSSIKTPNVLLSRIDKVEWESEQEKKLPR